MTYQYSERVVKRTVNETYDENGKLIGRETVEEFAPVQWPNTTGPYWWQTPLASHSLEYGDPISPAF